ncbi:MAG: twitching motility protein PilT [Treponema sp. RIFOXYC1_FULL_61_9]|nr:MAG: twitching motility protein PilT [Treponema sp. RIFOXYC1_FULL_61_9]
MSTVCHASLFRNGRNQAVRIPREMELAGKEVLIHREGFRLVIEPVETPGGLLALLDGLPALTETLPDIDAGLMPLDDVAL